MANINQAISGIVEVQNQTISKIKYNNNAITSISGILNTLSAIIDNQEIIEQKIIDYFSEVSGNLFVNVDLSDFYNKSAVDENIHNIVTSGINNFREEFINEIFNLKFAEVSGQFVLSENIPTKLSQFENDEGYLKEHQSLDDYATKAEISSLISEEVDPIFNEYLDNLQQKLK